MIIYMGIVIGIGIAFMKRTNKNSESYFLGGRTLGPWITAMSAGASDMSGWLLMGLPGVCYWCGLADAVWTAVGLAIGTYVNWLIVSKNIYQGLFKKNATDKQVMWTSRIVLLVITLIAVVIALDENSVIFTIVSFAWAGFGATFGPLVLFSLFWKRMNRAGAIAGMIGGGLMVFFWKLVIRPLGGAWNIYELLPAFIFSSILIIVVSLLTKEPSDEIKKDFDEVKAGIGIDM